MIKSLAQPFWAAGLCLLLFSCGQNPDPAVIASRYPEEIGQIVVQSCAVDDCHAGPNAAESLDLSSWTKLFQGSNDGSMIIPYSADYSFFFSQTNTYHTLGAHTHEENYMPLDAEPLDSVTMRQWANWINEGAKNVSGQYYWTLQETKSLGKIFNLCSGTDEVAVTDLRSNRIMRYFEVGENPNELDAPHFIIASPDQQFVYISLIEGGTIEKYRTDTYEFVSRVSVGSNPALITLSDDGSRAIISHFNSDDNSPKLTMLNTETMEIVGFQLIGGSDLLSKPHGIAVNKDFTLLYVGAAAGNYFSKYEIDADQGFVDEEKIALDPINSPSPQPNLEYQPYHMILNEEKQQLYISCNKKNQVRVYNTANDELITTISTGAYPRLMAFDPNSKYLFIACRDEENATLQGAEKGCISVIDTENLNFVKNIFRAGNVPHGIGISTTRNWLIVSSENNNGAAAPHHPVDGYTGPPGKYNIIDIATLKVLEDEEREISVFPNATVVTE